MEEAATRSYSAIANPENVCVLIDATVTTRFADRGEAMTRRYGERLSQLVATVPNGALLFFPQRRLMLDTLPTWGRLGLLTRERHQPLLGGKPVFVEGAQAVENQRIVETYKREAKRETGAVLCGVFRGRNAEGSNFPYAEARGIFLVGVPYADYSDPVVRA
jgi:Rad3-related DNA helicase